MSSFSHLEKNLLQKNKMYVSGEAYEFSKFFTFCL